MFRNKRVNFSHCHCSSLDPELHRHVMWLDRECQDKDFDCLELDFTASRGHSNGFVELVPGGKDIRVTASNKVMLVGRSFVQSLTHVCH